MHTDPAPHNVLYGFCASILFLVAGLKLFARPVRTESISLADVVTRWGVVITHLSTATAFTLAAPAVYLWIARTLGEPNAATLGVYVFILITSAAFQAVVVLWTAPLHADGQPRLAGWLVGYAVLIVVVISLFVAGDTSGEAHPIDFDAHYSGTPWISEFLLLYYAGFGASMGRVARLCHRYQSSAGGWLGRGLRWVAVGTAFALGYCVLKVVSVLGIMAGANWQALSNVWAPLSASIGAMVMIVGLTMPIAGPRLSGAGETWRLVRAYRDLYPLWRGMVEATPTIALEPGKRWAVRNLRYRLGRRMIEIFDGRLALAPYLDPEGVDAAVLRGQQGQELAAAREAALLDGAARAKRAGTRPGHTHPTATPSVSEQDDSDPAAQLQWLLLVSREYARLQRPGTRSSDAAQTPATADR